MCGRYTLTDPSDLAARFGLAALAETRLEPRFNIAPAQLVAMVGQSYSSLTGPNERCRM
jgi:putative SOS response-associated peptidase YedK